MIDVYELGESLITTGDLDPVYILLHHSGFTQDNLAHWLLAYFCYYHVGTASWIVDQPDYWTAMNQAAKSKDWPRCTERRHFRGDNAVKSIAWLESRGVNRLFTPFRILDRELSVGEIMEYVQTWVGFGPWIAFKVADMLERLAICRVSFDTGAVSLFDSPRKGAVAMWEREGKGNNPPESVTEWALGGLTGRFSGYKAPPRYERAIGVQEAETILCKWHGYLTGHYNLGEDIVACRRGLLRFSRCITTQRLLRAGKDGALW